MKYCERCKINVFDGHDNCPLCGNYLEQAGRDQDDYAQAVEPYVQYPDLVVKDDVYRGLLSLKAMFLLLVAAAVCVVLNCILDRAHLWSSYVAVGCFVAYTCAISAVYRKRRLYGQIAVDALVLTLAAFACELIYSFDVAGNASLFRYSLTLVVPILLAAALVTTDVMLFSDRHSGKYYFVTLWFVTLLATVPQIVVWSTGARFNWYVSFPLFFFAVTNAAVLSIVCWRRFKSELERKFFV